MTDNPAVGLKRGVVRLRVPIRFLAAPVFRLALRQHVLKLLQPSLGVPDGRLEVRVRVLGDLPRVCLELGEPPLCVCEGRPELFLSRPRYSG